MSPYSGNTPEVGTLEKGHVDGEPGTHWHELAMNANDDPPLDIREPEMISTQHLKVPYTYPTVPHTLTNISSTDLWQAIAFGCPVPADKCSGGLLVSTTVGVYLPNIMNLTSRVYQPCNGRIPSSCCT